MNYDGMYAQGHQINTDGPFKMYVTNEIETWRLSTLMSKEPETIKWVSSFRNGCVYWDIGANIGLYALFLQAIKDASQIYVFEPQRTNYERMIENAHLNGWRKWQPTAPCAISNFNGWARFIPGNNLPGSNDGRLVDAADKRQGYDIPVYTVDELCKWLSPCPNHIKIDTDGGEWAIVQGMQRTLQNPELRSVLIEVNDNGDDILQVFTDAGFSTDNEFNTMTPHSRDRRKAENIDCENVVFTRG
jgi:FkbM family methyltransferase